MASVTRRSFLGGAAAGAALLALPSAVVRPPPPGRPAAVDPRVAALIDRSRDRHGKAHVARAAFVDGDRAAGTLPITDAELAVVRDALASRELATLQQRGLRLGGDRYVLVRAGRDDAGATLHAVRPGAFVTVRAAGAQLVIATSEGGMAHGRAVDAVHHVVRQAARRDAAVG